MSFEMLGKQELVSCKPNATVIEAAKLMKEKNIGSILIVDEAQKPLGIVTDRDIAVRCVAVENDCSRTKVTEIMAQPLHTVRASDGIYNAIEIMKKTGVRRVPVINDLGKAVTIVSFGDLLKMLAQEFSDLTLKTTESESKLIRTAA